MKKLLIAVMINLLLLNIVLAEDKWEYKVYKAHMDMTNFDLSINLNDFGKAGWELITVNPMSARWDFSKVFIFKRKIEAEEAKTKEASILVQEAKKQTEAAEALRKAEEAKTKLAEIKRKVEEARTKEAEILAKEAEEKRIEEVLKAKDAVKEAEILAEEKAREAELLVKEAEILAKEAVKEAEEKRKLEEAKAKETVKEAEEKRKLEEAKTKEAEEKRKLEEEKAKLAEKEKEEAQRLAEEERIKLDELEAERTAQQLAYENKQYNRLLTEEIQAEQDQERLRKIQDQLTTLTSAYKLNIAARIKSFWRYQGAEDDWTAEVYVIQDRDGTVVAVDVRKANVDDSSKAKAFKDSIRRAVYKASPLPGAPDEAVFDEEIIFKFRVN